MLRILAKLCFMACFVDTIGDMESGRSSYQQRQKGSLYGQNESERWRMGFPFETILLK